MPCSAFVTPRTPLPSPMPPVASRGRSQWGRPRVRGPRTRGRPHCDPCWTPALTSRAPQLAVALPFAEHQLSCMPPHVQLAIAQFMPQKGDYRANLDRLRAIFAQIDTIEPHPDVLHLPETALTGYFV